jgi:hypothetical protein
LQPTQYAGSVSLSAGQGGNLRGARELVKSLHEATADGLIRVYLGRYRGTNKHKYHNRNKPRPMREARVLGDGCVRVALISDVHLQSPFAWAKALQAWSGLGLLRRPPDPSRKSSTRVIARGD